MALTFSPAIPPQEEPSGEINFQSSEVQFGEGYTQSMGEGMNDKIQVWPLTWVGTNAEIKAISDFFDTHKGYISFLWTPPTSGAVQGYYKVKKYTLVPAAAGNAKLNAVLEQNFQP